MVTKEARIKEIEAEYAKIFDKTPVAKGEDAEYVGKLWKEYVELVSEGVDKG